MNNYSLVPSLVGLVIIIVTQTKSVATAALGVVGHVANDGYAFNYAVNDHHTGDHKAQWEIKSGGVIQGAYSLTEPNGSLRIVDYTADDAVGFNAVVKRLGPSFHSTHNRVNTTVKIPVTYGLWPVHNTIGFSKTPISIPFWPAKQGIGFDKIKVGKWSLPWDHITGSYGGWVPLRNHGSYVTIISRKYSGGKIKTVKTGPISLRGTKIILRKRH